MIISSQSGHRLPALPQEQNDALATTPVDKQSTAITNVRTRSVENGVSYSLNGMPFDNQRGLYIKRSAEGRLQGKNGKKYVSK